MKYSNENETKYSSLISLEENSKFLYFSQFFNNILSFNNRDDKIKKCIFEIKNSFQKLGLQNDAHKLIEKYYEKYSDDIVFIYEYLKQSLLVCSYQLLIFVDFRF